MSTNADAKGWRDLADQLTHQQVASLEEWEANPIPSHSPAEHHHFLLCAARGWATGNLIELRYSDVPVPAGATLIDGWDTKDKTNTLTRPVEWAKFDTARVDISVDAWQETSGAYTPGISLYSISDGDALTAAEARELAAALLQAADELDRLNGTHPQGA